MRNLIINFHVIRDAKWFEDVILMLKSKFNLVPLSYFENLQDLKRGHYCHITFDDGDNSFYSLAFPVLKKHNVPVTLFVSPQNAIVKENFWFQEVRDYDPNVMNKIISNILEINPTYIKKFHFESVLKCLPLDTIRKIIFMYQDQTKCFPKPFLNMTIDEIKEVSKSGIVQIGAHTLNHPILKNETDTNCFKEITESIFQLENILERKILYFAYPNGRPELDFGKREIDILKSCKIKIAVSLKAKYITRDDNILALPRIGLTHGSINFIRIKLLMGSGWERIKDFRNRNINREKIDSILKSKSYLLMGEN